MLGEYLLPRVRTTSLIRLVRTELELGLILRIRMTIKNLYFYKGIRPKTRFQFYLCVELEPRFLKKNGFEKENVTPVLTRGSVTVDHWFSSVN
jgi:hypothetical protein